ncbi:hypothetical protein DYBT9623_04433 [Dyadobacter sp. CECT 9623]|uniref:Phage head morphogenesis domain-containing protein n=1 Tax=Dyadobacter linearis TaxID=2823330 RepID=A0ABM8UVQ2_9BACT|nr:hypothetical protein [Dyadobacter sp. CECT 9623]CAG5072895.1 hypothetical protein DYBT9623_04433 [Dyadobacter sp. CECT 9623]
MGKGEEDYARLHIGRIDAFALKVQKLYHQALADAIRIGVSTKHDPKKPFRFSDYPNLQERVNWMLVNLTNGIVKVINSGSNDEWLLAEQKNDDLVNRLFGKNLPAAVSDRFLGRNLEALAAFQNRKVNGLDLSKRVWRHTKHFKSEMEMALDVGLLEGKSARQLSQDTRAFLDEPAKLFRRVRDARGQLHLSKRAALYKPGQGVYRSSYKNAMRLTRTETNMAYRESDHERWQSMDFVVGIEIRRSNHPYECPTCGPLAGRYPKQFKFTGWHPQCRCHAVAILSSKEERDAIVDRILAGEETSAVVSKNEVRDMPDNYNHWVDKNRQRLLRAPSKPYFIRDNYGNATALNLSLDLPKMPESVIRTRAWVPSFGERSAAIANELNVIVTPVNLKSDKRILEKARLDYGGDVTKVKDIIRNTFIATNDEKYDQVVAKVKSTFSVDKVKQQTPDRDPMGYSGTLMQIKENGIFAEVQVNTAQMIYGKESAAEAILGKGLFDLIKQKSGMPHGLGHKFYEEFRVLDEKRPGDLQKIIRLKAESRAYYTKLRTVQI